MRWATLQGLKLWHCQQGTRLYLMLGAWTVTCGTRRRSRVTPTSSTKILAKLSRMTLQAPRATHRQAALQSVQVPAQPAPLVRRERRLWESHSRNLNHLWSVGRSASVMMWDAPFVEFYYPAFSDETHVTVDIQNAAEKFAALRNDEQRQQKLLANAERVSQELFCPSCLESYWRKLIRRYRSYFRLDAVLDDRETLRRLLAGLDVSKT